MLLATIFATPRVSEGILRAEVDLTDAIIASSARIEVDATSVAKNVTKVGGISAEHRIAQYADDQSILFVPHGWNTAVGLAADLQLVAAAGTARWVEYLTPAPYIEDLMLEPIQLTADGLIQIPDGPGLGMDWNPEGIRRFTGGMQLTPSVV